MSIPLLFASLCDGQEVFVWSDYLFDLGTEFLVGNVVFFQMQSMTLFQSSQKTKQKMKWYVCAQENP